MECMGKTYKGEKGDGVVGGVEMHCELTLGRGWDLKRKV